MRDMRALGLAVVVIVFVISWQRPVISAEFRKLTLSGGAEIEYALTLPDCFNREDVYPALLVFPGGRQTMRIVRGALRRYWEAEAVRRGFIVIGVAAPNGVSFIDGSERLVPELLRYFLSQYRIKGRKFHVGGNSNGGKSAFRVAIRYPDLFHSITVLTGFPPEVADMRHLDRLKGIQINMFVGESDPVWLNPMLEAKTKLEAFGIGVFFQSLPRNGHFLPDLSFDNSGRIFDRIMK